MEYPGDPAAVGGVVSRRRAGCASLTVCYSSREEGETRLVANKKRWTAAGWCAGGGVVGVKGQPSSYHMARPTQRHSKAAREAAEAAAEAKADAEMRRAACLYN